MEEKGKVVIGMDMKVAGELIEMNAHMIETPRSEALYTVGVFFALVGVALFVIVFFANELRKEWKLYVLFSAIAIAGFYMVYAAGRLPKIQEIHACANGPISLEQVAAVYDIVKVDGKELILRTK